MKSNSPNAEVLPIKSASEENVVNNIDEFSPSLCST